MASVSQPAMEDLAIEEESVDFVVCRRVFPHFADKPSSLGLIAKVLKPEGALLIVYFECRDVINVVHCLRQIEFCLDFFGSIK